MQKKLLAFKNDGIQKIQKHILHSFLQMLVLKDVIPMTCISIASGGGKELQPDLHHQHRKFLSLASIIVLKPFNVLLGVYFPFL